MPDAATDARHHNIANGEVGLLRVEGLKTWFHTRDGVVRAVDGVDCLLTGRPCQLSAKNALIATEIIFAAWESSRRRGRVECPFNGNDNALAAMVADGALKPIPAAL